MIDWSDATEQHLAALRENHLLTSKELVRRMPELDWHLTLTDIVWDSQAYQAHWWMRKWKTQTSSRRGCGGYPLDSWSATAAKIRVGVGFLMSLTGLGACCGGLASLIGLATTHFQFMN